VGSGGHVGLNPGTSEATWRLDAGAIRNGPTPDPPVATPQRPYPQSRYLGVCRRYGVSSPTRRRGIWSSRTRSSSGSWPSRGWAPARSSASRSRCSCAVGPSRTCRHAGGGDAAGPDGGRVAVAKRDAESGHAPPGRTRPRRRDGGAGRRGRLLGPASRARRWCP